MVPRVVWLSMLATRNPVPVLKIRTSLNANQGYVCAAGQVNLDTITRAPLCNKMVFTTLYRGDAILTPTYRKLYKSSYSRANEGQAEKIL